MNEIEFYNFKAELKNLLSKYNISVFEDSEYGEWMSRYYFKVNEEINSDYTIGEIIENLTT